MRPGLAVALALLSVTASAVERGRGEIAVVVDKAEAAQRPELGGIADALRARRGAALVALTPAGMDDPIARGRMLADLERRDLVVAVGDDAAEFATREVAETPVYFVAVAVLQGDRLAAPSVGGIFSYNVNALLDAARRLDLGRLGLAYTPGYEPVAEWVRRGAAARGLPLSEARIAGSADIVPAVRALLKGTRAIWVVGDPLLVRGAGFDYLRRNALSRGVAIIAPDGLSVRRGALLAFEAPPGPLAREALDAVDEILSASPARRHGRLAPAPPQGTVLVNAALAERWRLAVPRGPSWRLLR